MHVVPTPVIPLGTAGGTCYACRDLRRGQDYYRTYIDIVGEGEIVLCAACVGAIAKAAGYIPSVNLMQAKVEIEARGKLIDALTEKANAFEAMRATLEGTSRDPHPIAANLASEVPVSEQPSAPVSARKPGRPAGSGAKPVPSAAAH